MASTRKAHKAPAAPEKPTCPQCLPRGHKRELVDFQGMLRCPHCGHCQHV